MLKISSYPQVHDNYDVKKLCNSLSRSIKALTDLQKKAIETPEFWDCSRNIVVQAAAGTGKTLLTIFALMANKIDRRRLLYLVPYKALLNEKYKMFKEYFDRETIIYRSSSDYFEDDDKIFTGDCDIAILIYEKLENYLRINRKNDNIFGKYDLIVFDELSIMMSMNRGLRVHYILKKYEEYVSVESRQNTARIIGLTVPECKMPEYKELNFLKIFFSNRNVVLKEAIYQADEQIFYPKDEEEKWIFEIKFKQKKKFMSATSILEEKDDLDTIQAKEVLKALVFEHRKRGHNIIIFCNNKQSSKGIAKYLGNMIKERLSDYGDWSRELCRIKNELDDNGFGCIDKSLEKCSKYGVMIHNADLPYELRSEIEKEFSRKKGKSRINIIVSTETLAYGINSSTDVVIVFNRAKITDMDDYPSNISTYGNYFWRYINRAEYQNFIGRAGRLGFFAEKSKYVGYAYLLTKNEMSTSIVRRCYYNEENDNLPDCLHLFYRKLKKKPQECVMYILDFLEIDNEQFFSQKDIADAIRVLTGRCFVEQRYTDIILEELVKYNLIEEEGSERYSLSRIGEALRGKHFSVLAIKIFDRIHRRMIKEDDFKYSKFLLIYDLCELLENLEYGLISRKKEELLEFLRKYSGYIDSLLQSGQISLSVAKVFRKKLEQYKECVLELIPINENGYCYLSVDLAYGLIQFSNTILICEWSNGALLQDIYRRYQIKVTVGYIQNITNQILYLLSGVMDFVGCYDGKSKLIEMLNEVREELKYGYPYSCMKGTIENLPVSCRPQIGRLLKRFGDYKTVEIIKSFQNETEEMSSNYMLTKRFRNYVYKILK